MEGGFPSFEINPTPPISYSNLSVNQLIKSMSQVSASMEQYEYRLSLLDEYARSLERENQAKNSETRIIYQQLDNLTAENNMLKTVIEQTRKQMQMREMNKSLTDFSMKASAIIDSHHPLDQSIYFMDVQCQANLDEQEELKQLSEIMLLNDKLRSRDQVMREKQEIICQYQADLKEVHQKMEQYLSQNQQMYEVIEKLEQEGGDLQEKNYKSEEKIRHLLEKNRALEERSAEMSMQLQELNFKVYNTTEQSQNQKQIQSYQSNHLHSELDRMVKENNQLIQRIRQLQKEKNSYYSELKRATQISFGSNQNSIHASNVKMSNSKASDTKRRQIKGERWNMIEEKIKSIKSQNEKIQANLIIK